MARSMVRRQGEGLSVEQVADKVTEAEWRERETRQQLHSPGHRGPYGSDPQGLVVEQWTARHREWRRVAVLMEEEGWELYRPSPGRASARTAGPTPWPARPRGSRNSRTYATN
ncbi:hypothetical protein [Streptomyces sp. NPDC006285]|uniref:hypothetical protein n=1 Tax=Streptomyces sp. NPDC006285 TaxID=3364742 RepID=UPI003686D422